MRGVDGTASSFRLVIAAHGSQGIKVVLDNGNAYTPGDTNRLLYPFNRSVAARAAEDDIAEIVKHHDADLETKGFDAIFDLPDLRFCPRAGSRARIVGLRHDLALWRIG